jgi:hypothetical protein
MTETGLDSDGACPTILHMINGLLLHSMSYSGWGQPNLTLDGFVDKAADLGFDGVMLMAKRPHLSVLIMAQRMRPLAPAHRGPRHARSASPATNFTGDLAHPDIPGENSRFVTSPNWPAWPTILAPARFASSPIPRTFDALPAPMGHDRQFPAEATVAPPNSMWCSAYKITDIAVDPEAFDLVRVNHDHCRASSMLTPALQGLDIESAARKLGALTVHTTVANYSVRPQFRYLPSVVNYEKLPARAQAVPMDEGFIDYPAFFKAMTEGGFEGTVAYEMCSALLGGATLENLDRHAASFLQYMHSGAASGCAGQRSVPHCGNTSLTVAGRQRWVQSQAWL